MAAREERGRPSGPWDCAETRTWRQAFAADCPRLVASCRGPAGGCYAHTNATPEKGEPPMDQNIINLYDRFTHGGMNRREFLDRLTDLVGSAAAAAALVPLLQSNYAQAAIVAPDDARLAIDTTSYDGSGTKINGYLARLKQKGKRPAVIVIHENRGLTPHIQDITRRIALAGYLALGVDILTPQGGTPTDEDKARDLFAAAVPFLEKHAESTGNVGAIGFCWGGGVVNRVAVLAPSLKAGVAYYGVQVPATDVPAIRAPLLLHYAGNDERVNAGIAAYEAALKANQKRYALHMYEGAQP